MTSTSLGDGENMNIPLTTDLSFGVMDLNSCVVTIIDTLAFLMICLRLKKRFVIIEAFVRCRNWATQSSRTKR